MTAHIFRALHRQALRRPMYGVLLLVGMACGLFLLLILLRELKSARSAQ